MSMPRITIKTLIMLVAFAALVMGALRGRSALGVFVLCVLMMAFLKTGELDENPKPGRSYSSRITVGRFFRMFWKALLVVGCSDMIFLIIYVHYDILRLDSRSHRSFRENVSVFGTVYGLVMALGVARWLRLCFWSDLTKKEKWSELAVLAWLFLGVFIVGFFTSMIFRGW